MPNPKFVNPYLSVPEDQMHRTQCFIDDNDWSLLRQFDHGFATIAINQLIYKFCNELRKRNITSFVQRDEFEQFVSRFIITDEPQPDGLPNLSPVGTSSEDNGRTLNRGTKGKSRVDKKRKDVGTDPKGTDGSGE